MDLISQVKGFEGPCKPTWLNQNTVCNRLDNGVTGYFKLTKISTVFGIPFTEGVGHEFHGIINNGIVTSTESVY